MTDKSDKPDQDETVNRKAKADPAPKAKAEQTTKAKADPATDQVAKLQAELDKTKNDYLYLMAEFDNFRRNAIKERSELTKFGSERFVREFLNVFDNFERALEAEITTDNVASFQDGVRMIAGEFRSLLQRFQVNELKSEGEVFDPSKHEALSSEPRDDLPPGSVARVFKKAYVMHDKLIRPAQVTVSSAVPTAPPTVN